jgi:hypothetical protein
VQRKHSSPQGGTLMISESFFTPGPSSVLAHSWALSVFRVEDHLAQQRVLRALDLLGRADLTAFATRQGRESFVIIDWDSTSGDVDAKQIVMTADRHAAITFTNRERQASLP